MQNELDSLYEDSVLLFKDQKITEGLQIVEQLASKGHIRSQRDLGTVYLAGLLGFTIDYKKAAYWFNEAIKGDDCFAYHNLAYLFMEGLGVEKDEQRAVLYFKKAAYLGFASSQAALGDFYFEGKHVEFNRDTAEKYYLEANSQGDKHAAFMLGFINLFKVEESGGIYETSKNNFESCKNSPRSKDAKVMTQLLSSAVSKEKQTKLWDLEELINKLTHEHDSNIYYRGQTAYYGQPLCPSMNRFPHSTYPIMYEGDARLRQSGKMFYFEDAYRPKQTNVTVKQMLSGYLCNALGYPLTQALFQQAGYTSEGLDITSDPVISLFFSTYDYDSRSGTFYVDEKREYSVLYRWKNLNAENNFLQSDYYSCKNLIPTFEIFNSLESCDTIQEFFNSVADYARAIDWGPRFDLSQVRFKRPYHLLKLPKDLLQCSRVIKQKGYLLLPDVVMTEHSSNAFDFKTPRYMKNLPFKLIQDLSEDSFCEAFIYKRNNQFAQSILKNKEILPDDLYNEKDEDLTHLLLYGWFETLYLEIYRHGTPVVEFGKTKYDMTYMQILDYLAHQKRKKQKAGYYFE